MRSGVQGWGLVMPYIVIMDIPIIPSNVSDSYWLIARGAFGGLGFMCYFKAVSCLPLGDAITLFSLYPIVTVIAAWLVLKESLTKMKCASVLLSIFGAVLIARPTFVFGNP